MVKIIFLIFIMLPSFYLTEQTKLSHDAIIEKKNIVNNTLKLKAGENVDPNSVEEEHLMLSGTRGFEAATKSKMLYKTRNSRYILLNNQIDEEFDARKRWPQCTTIGEVHNDGNTLWSWAYAISGAFTDRMCIATNGTYNQLLSTQELISSSGIKSRKEGNVHHFGVWRYFKTHGLVSGGKYNTNDHIFKVSHKDIQMEVQNYGPVSVQFLVYKDFFFYKSGVYAKPKNLKYEKWQYAKLIGWGVENGVKYWLLVNSWGYEWGQNGLFKIKRGTDECRIERWIYAGEPETKQYYVLIK